MKPHFRLHFHWFDGKTPLWWVRKTSSVWRKAENWSTGGYTTSTAAIVNAAKL